MTAIGYGSDAPDDIARFEKYWPADLHLVGKEIIRFHCVYWPAFLMAANLPLPKKIVAHGWLLFEDSKMSKSRGNIVRTETILDAFGPLCPPQPSTPTDPSLALKGTGLAVPAADGDPAPSLALKGTGFSPSTNIAPGEAALAAEGMPTPATKAQQDLFASDILRYFLLREIPFGQDGSFSFDALVQRYNSDLANGYGNLVSRTLKMIEQNQSGHSFPDDCSTWGEADWLGYAFAKSPGVFLWSDATKTPPSAQDFSYDTQYHVIEHAIRTRDLFAERYGNVGFQGLLAEANLTISITDKFLSREAPWKLAKNESPEPRRKLAEILYTAAESIRIITALLYPILPYATASVWRQLGLGDIEEAAARGDLKDLKWGGLTPGTKLGPLSPIFPRADKSLIETMTQMEQANAPKIPTSQISDEPTTNASAPPADPTHPAAGPRTPTPNQPSAPVAGSHALTTERPGTPPHTEAHASGVFASQPATCNLQPATSIAIDDFIKIELRVAQIVVAERIPKADKLLRLEVDLGYETRQILSGIAEWYTPEELIGRRIAVVANLAPRKMRGLESHGMLLAASAEDHSKPILATFSDEIPLGSRIR